MWWISKIRRARHDNKLDRATMALLGVYEKRRDLRRAYPEVARGDLSELTKWASRVATGQVKDSDGSSLMPHANCYSGLVDNHRDSRHRKLVVAYLRRHLRVDPKSDPATSILHLSDLNESYRRHVRGLLQSYDLDSAMNLAIGGNYRAFGIIQRELLIQNGLRPEHHLIDVGCGSGRLAHALREYLRGNYLGTDVVPELLEYARQGCPSSWRFEMSDELIIPEASSRANMVCFFSVFTHLLHEQTYEYLLEAVRVLKPGGKIVFSFLEFEVDASWAVFEAMTKTRSRTYLNMFISRDAIQAWARHLGLKLEVVLRGDDHCIPLRERVVLDDGSIQEKFGALGQSVAVLVKT